MAIIANAKMLLDDPDAIWSYVILCDATSLTRKNAYSTSTGIKANDAHL
jgi:hypothetical protein